MKQKIQIRNGKKVQNKSNKIEKETRGTKRKSKERELNKKGKEKKRRKSKLIKAK